MDVPLQPTVRVFFHPDSGTFSYVAHAAEGGGAAIIDPVLDYDAASTCAATQSADAIVDYVRTRRLCVRWILDTHAHADHLSAGGHLRTQLGAQLAVSRGIVGIQAHFKDIFGLGDAFAADGRQFDRLLDDGDALQAGEFDIRVLATPGHTSNGLTYLIGDAAFVGDTLFAPDVGSARCDFPGGDAATLYDSIQRILALPAATRLYLCHDYPPAARREPVSQSSVAEQRARNVHVGGGTARAAFVAMRQARDTTLSPPRLMLPALKANIRGGALPAPAASGVAGFGDLR